MWIEGGIVGSRSARRRYCRCGTRLAADNSEDQCARCQRAARDKLIAPPHVPPEFWQAERFQQAFDAQHIGWISRAYRTHPHHYAVYGSSGISQTLLGQWLGLSQAQISRIETGAPIRDLDTLQHWVRVLRIPAESLWFRLLPEERPAATESAAVGLVTRGGFADDPERDPVLVAPWNHRGTVEVAVMLSGGDGWVKRRAFVSLTGPALTAPAHQWLVHEPEPLVSGLAGRRVSGELVGRLSAMVAEPRRMDDVAGGGSVLAMAQQTFGWVAGLLDRAPGITSARGGGCTWCSPSWDSCVAGAPMTMGTRDWRSATSSPACGLHIALTAGYSAPTFWRLWLIRPLAKDSPPMG